ncbi:pentatricopeptide repeat-containing protein eli1, chloroplastic [Nicotiana attenuata]|uniref:Pentatricopeptide repeat-containing protein eli1, chloroplastic n=1 Tax=Nicotiana attenuata TaxID=49451 RepID=A0A1J6L009_NICAT|nr:pentatricopeptide repeat-containing protein eli1, chloroplastic [Nicotiana attenuata]
MYVATSLLNAYAGTSFDCAYKLFDEIPVRNTVTWNSMISCFSRSGDVKGARKMFDQMPLRDLASWSSMIAGYMNNGHCEEGVALFQELVIFEQLKPDQVTIWPILAGCSKMCSIGLLLGKSVHGFVVKSHLELNVELGTCLVDMYAKCGFMNFASLVFDMMKDRNVVTWTALICGAAKHAFGTESLEIFKKMRQGDVLPNEFRFTGVLSACVQAGLVNEGRGYFKMTKECGLWTETNNSALWLHG